MDSNKIKNLAFGARDALRAEVAARIDAVLAEGSPERLGQPMKVHMLEAAVADRGRDAVVESSAYTWFNRLCALRFMDARSYTPVPVVTPRPGATQPAILADSAQGVFDPDFGFSRLVRDRVQSVLAGGSGSASNRLEAAYGELLVAVCDYFAQSMPYLFGEAAASSLAMPRGLLAEGSILRRIVEDMDDEACASVEVLGWLYQFYVSERKDEFFASKRKATADDIAPATQLFTPNWIVRYLVENSLGRLWMLNNPASSLAEKMDYYIAPEGETEDFIRVYSPEELTLCDPACGSGHILVYAFDLLYEIYLEEGYLPEDIPALILQKNLYGMEIDARAAEIARFALEMKALEKDSDFLGRGIDANITVLEPIAFSAGELDSTGLFASDVRLLEVFEHMGEVGSLYVPDAGDTVQIDDAIRSLRSVEGIFAQKAVEKLEKMKCELETLSLTYDCVVANPPYMGSGNLNPWMSSWVKDNYSDEKGDLCTCFIKRGFSLAKDRGYLSMVTMHSWMFLSSFEKMRSAILRDKAVVTMAHFGAHAFDQVGGEVVQVTASVLWNGSCERAGDYVRLVDFPSSDEKEAALKEAVDNASCSWRYRANQQDFGLIPGMPIAYWASRKCLSNYSNGTLVRDVSDLKKGMSTGDNNRFMRLWSEVDSTKMELHANRQDALHSTAKWFPINSGGGFCRWYGNNIYLVNWGDDGNEMKENAVCLNHGGHWSRYIVNVDKFFLPGITWNGISTSSFSARYFFEGSLFSSASMCAFAKSPLYLLALLNSSVCDSYLSFLAPTLNYGPTQIGQIPYIESGCSETVTDIVSMNINIARADWDSFEVSWDFSTMPLAQPSEPHIVRQFERWSGECNERFSQLKVNEEELNRIFARIYGMDGEVTIEVPEDKVSVHRADLSRDVRALVSYGVGCIMGRYSVYKPGLILADTGQSLVDFDAKVPGAPFRPDENAIVPVLNGEWFADDVVAQFRKWLEVTYGRDTLEENVDFIERALGKDLRTYFVKEFYKDHCATYQVTGSGKRPIYWMFSSPKGSFKVLVYMHRYTPSTVGQILTGYLREYMAKLNASIGVLDQSERSQDKRQADKYRAVVRELSDWERDVVYPLANERIAIDLDDGVKVNYNKFPYALAKVAGLSTWR